MGPMRSLRTLARPALCVQLLLLSAGAGAFCVTPLSHRSIRCLATERPALGMNAGAGSPIPELAVLYEVMPQMTYNGWECDAETVKDLWVRGRTSASIKERVEQMRRKQRLHEGDAPFRCGVASARRGDAGAYVSWVGARPRDGGGPLGGRLHYRGEHQREGG